MKEFTEDLRYEYPCLTEDSWVIDIGAHKGEFSRKIGQKYNCNILGFEPITEFWNDAMENQAAKVHIIKAAVGSSFRNASFNICGDSTGEYAQSDWGAVVPVIPIDAILDWDIEWFDLVKINAEGGEYEILDRMLETSTHKLVRNIQVQFHNIKPGAESHRDSISSRLSVTHHRTYNFPFVWESWEIN